uniref:Uncharacterized protein n=1 Tax=Anguilla anguilla TaxID=7936 RepID=A0A0E9VYK1_ANGAN
MYETVSTNSRNLVFLPFTLQLVTFLLCLSSYFF